MDIDLKSTDEIKIVIANQNDFDWAKKTVKEHSIQNTIHTPVILQAAYGMMTENELQSLNWDTVELETVNPHMRRRIVTGERMTVARIYLDDGFLVPLHSHDHEQITQVIKGRMRFAFGAK